MCTENLQSNTRYCKVNLENYFPPFTLSEVSSVFFLPRDQPHLVPANPLSRNHSVWEVAGMIKKQKILVSRTFFQIEEKSMYTIIYEHN